MRKFYSGEVSECQACGERCFDGEQIISAGDESLRVCPYCRTTEGDWKKYDPCECNSRGMEAGNPHCNDCSGKGWLPQ